MQEFSVNANHGTFPRKKFKNVRPFLISRFFWRYRAHFDKETFCKRWYISSKKIRRCHVQLSRHFLSLNFWHNTSSFLITELFANVGTHPRKNLQMSESTVQRLDYFRSKLSFLHSSKKTNEKLLPALVAGAKFWKYFVRFLEESRTR